MTDMTTITIPTALVPDVIDSLNDRAENLEDLAADDSFPRDLRAANQRLAAELRAVVQEFDDPGTVDWEA